jgi:predicted amidohydrolase
MINGICLVMQKRIYIMHPGNKRLVASVKGWRVNLQVCYDLRFPVWARQNNSFFNPMEDQSPNLICSFMWLTGRNGEACMENTFTGKSNRKQCYVIGLNRVGKDGTDICLQWAIQ